MNHQPPSIEHSISHLLHFGEQSDGGIIRPSGEFITPDDRLSVMLQYDGLPVHQEREMLKNFFDDNLITIIRANTGSGKSTQIPKMLAELFPWKNIVVTQPRVVAAVELANRVGLELICETGNPTDDVMNTWNPEGKVGYRTWQGNSGKKLANISYHTDGLELKRQIHGHVPDILVIDEVHGYSVPVEMLMKLYRDFHMKNKNIRLVIMSATIDSTNIKTYFNQDIPEKTIEWRQYPIKHIHKPTEDIVDTIKDTVWLILKEKNQKKPQWKESVPQNTILVFAPGKAEIYDIMARVSAAVSGKIEILPLHAQLSPEEKAYALRHNPDVDVRIVVSTNVAQESLTVPGVWYVVDTALAKTMYQVNGIKELRTQDTSQFDYLQRAGRTGRVAPGTAVLSHKKAFEDLQVEPTPPISRETLYSEILEMEMIRKRLKKDPKNKAKKIQEEIDTTWMLSRAIHNGQKPFVHSIDRPNLRQAYKELQQMGALDKHGSITPMGEALTKLPLSAHTGRILIESLERDCLLEILPMIAILEKQIFLHKDGKWKEFKIAGKEHGDLFAFSDLLSNFLRNDHSDAELNRFASLGVDKEEIEAYKKLEIRSPLWLTVDLSPIGVKTNQLKSIHFLIEDLKRRLPHIDERAHDMLFSVSVDLQKQVYTDKKIRDIKVSLTTGFLGHVFDRMGTTKNNNAWEKSANLLKLSHRETFDEFSQGNNSLLQTTHQGKNAYTMFVGQPFRIKKPDAEPISIALYLTPITEDILQEAEHHSAYDDRFAIASYDVANDTSITNYALLKEWYLRNTSKLNTPEKKKAYYREKCLPTLLIEQNPEVHDYARTLTWERQEVFARAILPEILRHEGAQIDVENIERTEQVFVHAPIVPKIQASEHPLVQAFSDGAIKNFQDVVLFQDGIKKENSFGYIEQIFSGFEKMNKQDKKPKEYYLNRFLPTLLIEHNSHFQKYFQTLSIERKAIFRLHILPRLLDQEGAISRVHPQSLEGTKRSFIHDTELWNALNYSADWILKGFVTGQIETMVELYRLLQSESGRSEESGSLQDESWEVETSRQLLDIRLRYVQLANRLKWQYCSTPEKDPIGGVEKFSAIVDEYIFRAILTPDIRKHLWGISEGIQSLWAKKRSEILSNIKKLQKTYIQDHKKQKEIIELLASVHLIEDILNVPEGNLRTNLLWALSSLWAHISPTLQNQIISCFDNCVSKNSRTKKIGEKTRTWLMGKQFHDIKTLIHEKQWHIASFPIDSMVHRLDKQIFEVMQGHFEASYFSQIVCPKLGELRNNILRHASSERDFFRIFEEFFQKLQLDHSLHGEEIYTLLQQYDDLKIELEPYIDHFLQNGSNQEDAQMNIQRSHDLSYVQSKLKKLQTLERSLEQVTQKINNFSVWTIR